MVIWMASPSTAMVFNLPGDGEKEATEGLAVPSTQHATCSLTAGRHLLCTGCAPEKLQAIHCLNIRRFMYPSVESVRILESIWSNCCLIQATLLQQASPLPSLSLFLYMLGQPALWIWPSKDAQRGAVRWTWSGGGGPCKQCDGVEALVGSSWQWERGHEPAASESEADPGEGTKWPMG